ncbi:hypothetical protein DPMN_174220 [Dreissena polymorpha]|uniref:Uncharacterized protein n=1 Tax=Dreissena polymorpha TaxID=45954 RepID=A0A9D4E504_DREPO|nr:hypothetical protein DPMN_174220 [Dreissena polymorpha]
MNDKFPAPWCPGGHVFQPIQTNFELFHDDRTINVPSRVLKSKNAPPGDHVFQPTWTISELFHEDRTINVASRVLTRKNAPPPGCDFHDDQAIQVVTRVSTRFYYGHITKGHAFQQTRTIFETIRDST